MLVLSRSSVAPQPSLRRDIWFVFLERGKPVHVRQIPEQGACLTGNTIGIPKIGARLIRSMTQMHLSWQKRQKLGRGIARGEMTGSWR
jgi:hypothetical protein